MKRPLILLAIFAVLLASSCTNKSLFFEITNNISVDFVWKLSPKGSLAFKRLAFFNGDAQYVFFSFEGSGDRHSFYINDKVL